MIRVDFQKLRFLIVDDNVNMRRILRTILNSLGAKDIADTGNGYDALMKLKAFQYDIIFTDWAMPDMSGIEFVKFLRGDGTKGYNFTPVIMVSGFSERKRVLEARDAGINEYLTKPISAKLLYERVASVIVNPRPFIRTATYFGPDHRKSEMPQENKKWYNNVELKDKRLQSK